MFWCYRKFSHWKWLNYESQTLNTLDETHPAIVIPNLKSTKKESEYKWSPHKIVQLMKQSPMWRRFGFNIARDTLKSNYTDTPCFHLHSKVVCCGFCLEKLFLASIVHLLPPPPSHQNTIINIFLNVIYSHESKATFFISHYTSLHSNMRIWMLIVMNETLKRTIEYNTNITTVNRRISN